MKVNSREDTCRDQMDKNRQTEFTVFNISVCVCVSQERGKASVGLGLLDLAYCPTLKSYNILNWKDIFNIVRCVHSQTFMLTLYRSIDALNPG